MARPRIHIIDDREEVRDAFSRALALDGYETRAAENADSAMEVVDAVGTSPARSRERVAMNMRKC